MGKNSLTKSLQHFTAAAVTAAALSLGASADAQENDNVAQSPDQDNTPALKVEQPTEATGYYDLYNPRIPDGLLWGGAALLSILTLYGARKGLRGTWLRAAAGGAVFITLCNPEFIEEDRQNLPTDVVVVTDRTQSQQLGNRHEMSSAAYEHVLRQLSSIEGVNVRTVEVGHDDTAIEDQGSLLFKTLREALSDIPRDQLGGVVMISDGQIHDVPADLSLVGEDTPFHALISGSDNDADRIVTLDEAPVYSFLGEKQAISFIVEDTGNNTPAGAKISVVLRKDGKELAQQTVTAGEISTFEVELDQVGDNSFVIEAEDLEGELTDINNRIVVDVEGVIKDINILLLSGKPHRGLNMWRELFKSSPDVNLVHFTTLRTADQQDHTPFREMALTPFPMKEVFVDKLADFDLVIMDNVDHRTVVPKPYLKRVAQYVKDGGSLLVVASEADIKGTAPDGILEGAMDDILPVKRSGAAPIGKFTTQVTPVGEKHPVTRPLVSTEKWGPLYRAMPSVQNSGYAVLSANASGANPILILNDNEDHRVAMITTDQFWLWATGHKGGGPYVDLFDNTAQWLLRNPSMDEERLSLKQREDTLVVTLQSMKAEDPVLILTSPTGEETRVEPTKTAEGLWSIEVPADEAGQYTVRLEGDAESEAVAMIGHEHPVEFQNTVSTIEKLEPIMISGDAAIRDAGYLERIEGQDGKYNLPIVQPMHKTDGQTVQEPVSGEGWLGIDMNDETLLKGFERHSLIPAWAALLAIAGLFTVAYLKEGEVILKTKNKKLGNDNDAPPPSGFASGLAGKDGPNV